MTIQTTCISENFWLVKEDGKKVGTLRKLKDKFLLSGSNVTLTYNQSQLASTFGISLSTQQPVYAKVSQTLDCFGFPTCSVPYNPLFDVRKKLAVFTKGRKSKSLFCAGYFLIKFKSGWVKSFCPKYSTIEHYQFKGPFLAETEETQRVYDDDPF